MERFLSCSAFSRRCLVTPPERSQKVSTAYSVYQGKIMSTQRNSVTHTLSAYLRRSAPNALAVLFLLAISILSANARTWLKPETVSAESAVIPAKAVAPVRLSPPSLPDKVATEPRMEALMIKLRRTGFEPVEIERTEGRFLLAFDNCTGADEIVLQLKQENGHKLHELRMPRGHVRWRKALNIPAGRYVLTVEGHPEWVSRITITTR